MNTPNGHIKTPPIDLERLRNFSDQIYAFSMTILVTALHLPTLSEAQAANRLFAILSADWRFFAAYAISFLTIASYWQLHQRLYEMMSHTDRIFIWMNLLLLLTATFLPFPTALMGKYGRLPETAFIYGVVISTSYLLINLIAGYTAQKRRLIRPDFPDRDLRILMLKLRVPLVFVIVGTLLALSYQKLAFLFYFLMALANTLPWPRLLGLEKPITPTGSDAG